MIILTVAILLRDKYMQTPLSTLTCNNKFNPCTTCIVDEENEAEMFNLPKVT